MSLLSANTSHNDQYEHMPNTNNTARVKSPACCTAYGTMNIATDTSDAVKFTYENVVNPHHRMGRKS